MLGRIAAATIFGRQVGAPKLGGGDGTIVNQFFSGSAAMVDGASLLQELALALADDNPQ